MFIYILIYGLIFNDFKIHYYIVNQTGMKAYCDNKNKGLQNSDDNIHRSSAKSLKIQNLPWDTGYSDYVVKPKRTSKTNTNNGDMVDKAKRDVVSG